MRQIVNEGEVYGRLTVGKVVMRLSGKRYIKMRECACACGDIIVVRGHSLTKGLTTSCGCFRAEVHHKHGLTHHPIRGAYYNAKGRCTITKNKDWKYYGGRGIEFRLGVFEEFAENMLSTWFEGATLDRKDSNGHYEYGNIRWITQTEQKRNTRRNRWCTFQGETLIVSDWARRFGIHPTTLISRINKYGVAAAFAMVPKIYTPRKPKEKYHGKRHNTRRIQSVVN